MCTAGPGLSRATHTHTRPAQGAAEGHLQRVHEQQRVVLVLEELYREVDLGFGPRGLPQRWRGSALYRVTPIGRGPMGIQGDLEYSQAAPETR